MSWLARTLLGRSTIAAALAALVLVVVPATAGAEPAALAVHPASTATVSGTVRDSRGNALGGWTVWFAPGLDVASAQSVVADSSGNYSIELPTATSWSTAITAPGSSPAGSLTDGAEAGINQVSVESAMTVDFTLPLVAVTATVLDTGGNPVPGATVSAPAVASTGLATPLDPGASFNLGWRSAQTATTDGSGQATLFLLAASGGQPVVPITVMPPLSSPFQAQIFSPDDLTTDSSFTVHLQPAPPGVPVTGSVRTAQGLALGFWTVAFMPAGQPDQATVVTAAANGSYAANVPEADDTVEIFDGSSLATPAEFVRSGGLVLTGPTTLDLTQPLVPITLHVEDNLGHPVVNVDMFTTGVGSDDAPVATGHLFSGSTGDVGVQDEADNGTDSSGNAVVDVLQSSTASSVFGFYPGQVVDPGMIPFTPSGPEVVNITVQVVQLVPGVGSVVGPTSGTSVLDIPVTLSVAPPNEVTVSWSTAVIPNAMPGQAPQSDYVAASGTLDFLPGQTTATIPITVTGNSTGANEYIAIGFHGLDNAELGGGPLHLAYGIIDAPGPFVVPGTGTVSAPVSGTRVLDVAVSLSAPSAATVTVHWATQFLSGASGVQAPLSNYVAASGTVTFAPGQTEATVPITVTGNSTGQEEYVVVSFSGATNAQIGGFWGLGFGLIDPAA